MVFIPISKITTPPPNGTKFKLVRSEYTTKDGTVKPDKVDRVNNVTLKNFDAKTKILTFSWDDVEEDTPDLTTGWQAGVYSVEAQGGGRRRTRRGRKSRKTRRARKH